MTLPLEEIAEAAASLSAGWEVGETSLTSMEQEERELRLGYTPGPGEPSLVEREGLAQANLALHAEGISSAFGRPASYDLRNVGGRNYVTPVKDQGSCGSCVAFGTVATVESTIRVTRQNPGLTIDLSEAHLFYCIARAQGRRCSGSSGGWWVPPALDGFKNTGVVDEPCYPYTPGDQNCTNLCANWQQRVTKIISWTKLTSPEQMKDWLSSKGALAACFTVYNDFFAYRSGIYRHVSGGIAGGHCVTVIGYDDTARCWICKNSWNTTWGEQGLFRIAYGECGIDSEMYGVTVPQDGTQRAPLYRYWNSAIGDHFYTTNWSELGSGRYGWAYEGIQCYVLAAQASGTAPLYRYWNSSIGDHFYTTNWGELGSGRYGWGYEGIQCYVLTGQASGTAPLYRYWNANIGDHFYTTNWGELGSGRYGWKYEGVQCYVYTAAAGLESSESEEIPSTFSMDRPEAAGLITPDASSFTLAESQGTPASFTVSQGSAPLAAGPSEGQTGDVPSTFTIDRGSTASRGKEQGISITFNINS